MLDYHGTYHSPINTSKSKQLYSFAKQSRFKRQQNNSVRSQNFYNLPGLLDKRAAGFGYGRKQLIFPEARAHQSTPPPNAYTIGTDVEQSAKSRKGLTISRKLNSESLLKKLGYTPGPGAYSNINDQMIKHGMRFNKERKKFEYPLTMRNGRQSPGPAAHSATGTQRQEVFLSRFRNSSSPKFGTERRMSNSSSSVSPGPSAYEGEKIIKSYIGNRFDRMRPVGFQGYSARVRQKSFQPKPSPSSYYIFSEFAVKQKPFKYISNKGLMDYRLRNQSTCAIRTRLQPQQKLTRLTTEPSPATTQTN